MTDDVFWGMLIDNLLLLFCLISAICYWFNILVVMLLLLVTWLSTIFSFNGYDLLMA